MSTVMTKNTTVNIRDDLIAKKKLNGKNESNGLGHGDPLLSIPGF